jgi:flagellar basal-body rod modification protein FlgD
MSTIETLVPNQTQTAQSGQIFSQADSDSATLAQDFDDFLQLLTTQLQNQDPLSPVESTEFTNQLVGFSQVEQQINMNDKLEQLITATQANSLQQALAYIGLDVSYEGQEFYNPGGGASNRFVYDLSDEVSSLTLRVVNEDDETVFERTGSTAPGLTVVNWDGKDNEGNPVEAGNYMLQLDIVRKGTDSVTVELGVSSRVTGIETREGTTYLAMGEVVIPLSQVFSAELPGSNSALVIDDSNSSSEDDTSTADDTSGEETDDTSET